MIKVPVKICRQCKFHEKIAWDLSPLNVSVFTAVYYFKCKYSLEKYGIAGKGFNTNQFDNHLIECENEEKLIEEKE